MRHPGIGIVFVALVLGGCGASVPRSEPTERPVTDRPAGTPTQLPPASGVVRTARPLTVLAYDDEPARACLGGTTETSPTRCSGEELRLTGFDWAGDPEPFDGVRQAAYVLTGRFDGTTLAVTRARLWDWEKDELTSEPLDREDDYRTACPEPSGGWRVVDPAKTTLRLVDRLPFVAEEIEGYNSFWFDDSRNPAPDHASTPVDVANDPRYLTANLLVSRDVPGAIRAMRRVWGGALCVRRTRYDLDGMQRLSARVGSLPGILTASSRREHLDIEVLHDDGSLQRWANDTFGTGIVTISSFLRPIG